MPLSSGPLKEAPDLGQLLIRQGLVTEQAVRECLQIQREMEQHGRTDVPRLGELLVQKGYLTEKQVVEALAAQEKKIYYCPRCDVQVNVVIRPDVKEYKCARCEGTLVLPGNIRDLKAVDSAIVFISKDPVPHDVIEAAKDPARRFGKYIIVNEIGHGSVGVIHRAWDTYLNQYVALKMIKPPPAFLTVDRASWQETRVLSLFKEARSAVRLRHPNIVPIYDVGRIHQNFFISMEYLEGMTLSDHLKKAHDEGGVSPFYDDPKKHLRIMRDIARALHYAHTRPSPIIHCDLKPSNVFIDRSGRGYVLDFGLAKDLRAVQSEQPGTIRGTPAYMAPEQASGDSEQIDARTDVYGLGCILYELLAGRPPFVGEAVDLMRQAIREKPLRPSQVIAYPHGEAHEGTTSRLIRVPPELEDICLRCLEKDPEKRYPTVKEVFEALDEILRGPGTQRRTVPTLPLAKTHEDLANALRSETRTAIPPTPPAPPAPPEKKAEPAPPPPAPARTPRRVASWAWALAGSVSMCAIVLLVYGALRLGSSTASAWDEARNQIEARTREFRPDLARASCLEQAGKNPNDFAAIQALQWEIDYVGGLRTRLIGALNASPLDLKPLRMRSGTISAAKIGRAGDSGLTVTADGKSVEVAWADVAPDQIAELAARCLKQLLPADRYGLGIYLEKNGCTREARGQFQTLEGTDLEIPARRHLEQLGK